MGYSPWGHKELDITEHSTAMAANNILIKKNFLAVLRLCCGA